MPRRRMLAPGDLLVAAAGVLGGAALLIAHGGWPEPRVRTLAGWLAAAAAALYALDLLLALARARRRRRLLAERWPAWLLLALAGGLVLWTELAAGGGLPARALGGGSPRGALLAIGSLYVLGNLVLALLALPERLTVRRLRPGLAFILLFALLIAAGAGLLLLPRATPAGAPLSLLDAVFTSTSAVCVTGLVVRDTGTELTRFGQTVVLLLIQLGGLGIMSLTATVSWALGRGVGLRETSFLREVFQVTSLADVVQTLRLIMLMTFGIEAVGAALLYAGFGHGLPIGHDRLFDAVFHAVSAFCNAGFSTLSDSLIGWAAHPVVIPTIMALIVAGGLGFAVVINLGAFLTGMRSGRARGGRPHLTVQTRIVLALTALLIAGGALALGALEWRGAFAGRPPAERIWLALFQSVTARTAGFNSLAIDALSAPSLFLLMVLMFVGAGPGSTAGGVKLTTMAVLWASVKAIMRGHEHPLLFGQEVREEALRRSLVVVTGALAAVSTGTFLLLLTEGRGLLTTGFEVLSALGTVGLSTGLTPDLTEAGRVIVVVLMFVGRLGPVTLAYGLARSGRARAIRHPEARLIIG